MVEDVYTPYSKYKDLNRITGRPRPFQHSFSCVTQCTQFSILSNGMWSVGVDEDRRETRSRIGKRGALFLFPSSGFCSLFLIGCWLELAIRSVHIPGPMEHTLLLLLAHDRRRVFLGFLVLGTG